MAFRIPSNPPIRLAPLAFAAIVLPHTAAFAAPPVSPASPPVVCVVRAAGVSDPDRSLEAALVIEQRKAGLRVDWEFRDAPSGCDRAQGPAWRLEVETRRVVLREEGRVLLDLAPVTLATQDRASEVARRVLSVLGPSVSSRLVPLADGDFPRVATSSPPPASRPTGTAGYVTAGGRYAWQPRPGIHLGGIDVEAGASWYDERLQAGLALGWMPRRSLAGVSLRSDIQSVALSACIRGGFRVRPILLRAAVGGGFEWRQVRTRPSSWAGTASATEVVPLLDGEVEAVAPLGRWMRLALAATVRVFPGGTRYGWNTFDVYDPPRVMVGMALRLGVVFGGGTR